MRCFFILVLLVGLSGCTRSPHAGFTEVADDVHIRLHALGDGVQAASDSDSVTVRLRIGLLGDAPGSLFSTERNYAAQDLRQLALAEAMDRLHSGDSMSLICRADRIPWRVIGMASDAVPGDKAEVMTELTLLDIRTPARLRAEREQLRRADPLGFERRLIAAWLKQKGDGHQRWGTSDLFYRLEGSTTDTVPVKRGEQVTVAYTGSRLEDGVVVDDTERYGGTFSWRYGDPDQVINGLEVAVSLLLPGTSGDFVLPSTYAFGERGVPELVEPHTPMHYRVQLVHVTRATPK